MRMGTNTKTRWVSFEASRSIAGVGYDLSRQVLKVKYRGGNVYEYSGVPLAAFTELIAAPSKGRFVNHYIKERYPYRLVSH